MSLKVTDHIVIFVEKNNDIVDVIKNHAKYICENLRCDNIFFVDKLDVFDICETIEGILMKALLIRSDKLKLNEVEYDNSIGICKIDYVDSNGTSKALLVQR